MTLEQRKTLEALPKGDIELFPVHSDWPQREANRVRSYLNNSKPFWCWKWSVLVRRDSVVIKKVELKPLAVPSSCPDHNHRAIESAAKRSANA